MRLTVDDNLVNRIFESLAPVKVRRRKIESSIESFHTINMWEFPQAASRGEDAPKTHYEYSRDSFQRNRGTMEDGERIYIDPNQTGFYYTAVFTRIKLKERKEEKSKLWNLKDRSRAHLPTMQVYVDGVKIPDANVVLYVSNSSTTIFIPFEYIKSNSQVFVERRNYGKKAASDKAYKYENNFVNNFSGDNIVFDFVDNSVIHNDYPHYHNHDFLVFLNGIRTSRYNVIRTGSPYSRAEIRFTDPLSGVDVEIFFDIAVEYRSSGSYSDGVVLFNVPMETYNPVHGGIPVGSCLFFVDGKRIPSDEIEQVGRVHWRWKESKQESGNWEVYVTDKGFIDQTKDKLISSSHFIYNMYGVDNVTKALLGEKPIPAFDDDVSIEDILTSEGRKYDDLYYREFVDGWNDIPNFRSRLAYMVDQFPDSVRNIFDNLSEKNSTYRVLYNAADTEDIFVPTRPFDPNNRAIPILYINGYHVPPYVYRTVDRHGVIMINVPKDRLIPNEYNTVEVRMMVHENNGPRLTRFERNDIKLDNRGMYSVTLSGFKNYESSDLIITYRDRDNDNQLYISDETRIGLFQYNNVLIEKIDEDRITIVFPYLTDIQYYYVYNKRFSAVHQVEIPETTIGLNDMLIPFINGDLSNPIPIITQGQHLVYVDDTPLIPEIDYIVQTPETIEELGFSGIIIKRQLEKGTRVTIYTSPINNRVFSRKEGVVGDDTYGLIYLGDLPFPYSNKYMRLQVNGRRLPISNVKVISDKLVRIIGLKTPLYDLQVFTQFSVDYGELIPFIELYEPNGFEKQVANAFISVDTYNVPELDAEYPDAKNIFAEYLYENLDGVYKKIYGSGDPVLIRRYDLLLQAYLMYKKSDRTKEIFNTERFTPDLISHLRLYTDRELDDVMIRVSGGNTDLLEEMSFGYRNYSVYTGEDSKILSQFLLDKPGSSSTIYDRYARDSRSNDELYEYDIPRISARYELDEDVIIGGLGGVYNPEVHLFDYYHSYPFDINNDEFFVQPDSGLGGNIVRMYLSPIRDLIVFRSGSDNENKIFRSMNEGFDFEEFNLNTYIEDDIIGPILFLPRSEAWYAFGSKRMYEINRRGEVVSTVTPDNYHLIANHGTPNVGVVLNDGSILLGVGMRMVRIPSDFFRVRIINPAEVVGSSFTITALNYNRERRIIYVGTTTGVFVSIDDGRSYVKLRSLHELSTAEVKDIAISRDNTSIAITTSNGLFLSKDGRLDSYRHISVKGEEIPTNNLTKAMFDHRGALFIGTNNHGLLASYDYEEWVVIDKDRGLRSNRINDILIDNYGGIFVGTSQGLSISENLDKYTTPSPDLDMINDEDASFVYHKDYFPNEEEDDSDLIPTIEPLDGGTF